jgi:hypothetical protein
VNDFKTLKYELQNIIAGKSSSGESDSIQAAKAYIKTHTRTGSQIEDTKPGRAEEERALKDYAKQSSLFINKNNLGEFITSGAEQKIYYKEGDTFLYKVADGIFYVNWTDYFNNLLLHNFFFPDTLYKLAGFSEDEAKFCVVVKQSFVLHTENTSLTIVKDHLLSNGFEHKKNNDYFHPYLGIILEDLHDENVLTNNGVLFFVDTVFYLTEDFYKKH